MSRAAPYLELLRTNPASTRLYVAQLASFAGDWFATVALLGLVLEVTDSAARCRLPHKSSSATTNPLFLTCRSQQVSNAS